jgi:hypothetical protein
LYQGTNAWAPAVSISSLVTRRAISTSPKHHRYRITSLYVGESIDEKKDTTASDPVSDSFLESAESHILGEPIPYSKLTIGVLKETFKGENRVSQVSLLCI